MSTFVNSDNSGFFDPNHGIGFQSIKNHFIQQSKGSLDGHPALILPLSRLSKRRKNGSCKLRVIKLASKTQSDQGMPKLEVVDPDEANRRRVASELAREVSGDVTQTVTPVNGHTQPVSRGGKTSKKRQTTSAAVKTRVKRARDIFDP